MSAQNKLSMDVIEKATEQVETALAEYSLERIHGLSAMQQSIKLATGMAAMRTALSLEIVERLFMPLQGTSLGFRTDKDKDGGYPTDIVKTCVIEAMMRGFYPVGNEFNIIAERAYFTKEGYDRKVRELPGLTDLEFFPGVPQLVGDKGALVPYRASWTYQGKPMGIVRDLMKRADGSTTDERIPVRVNSGMGADGILGKARRKILAQIYETCTGIKALDGDVSDSITTTGEAVPEQTPANKTQVDELVEKHRAKAAAKNGETKAETQQASIPSTAARDSGQEG